MIYLMRLYGRDYTGIKSVSLALLSELQRQYLVNGLLILPMAFAIFHHFYFAILQPFTAYSRIVSLAPLPPTNLYPTTRITATAGTGLVGTI